MFIEYKWINSVLYYRYKPNGEFKKCSLKQLSEKVVENENQIKRYYTENIELLEALKAAIAALSQNKIFPADIKAAKKFLNNAIANAEGK